MPTAKTSPAAGDGSDVPCDGCPNRETGICKTLLDAARKYGSSLNRQFVEHGQRRNLQRTNKTRSEIRILRSGWVSSFVVSNSGGRLIVNFLLPGDPLNGLLMSDGRTFHNLASVTEGSCCAFDRKAFMKLVRAEPLIFDECVKIMSESWQSLQKRLFDLSMRNAEHRILSLALDIYERTATGHRASDGRIFFPLRQYHLADATGLTTIHVNRVLQTLKRDGILKIENESLQFMDLDEVRARLQ